MPTRPPPESLAWAAAVLGSRARVVGWRRLTGGIASTVHRLAIVERGRRRSYVLRWWADGATEYAARVVTSEAGVLTALAGGDVPVPRLCGATTERAHGGPALLMTRVPGRISLVPRDRERWL